MSSSPEEPETTEPAALPREPAVHDPYSALRNPSLRNYLLGNVLAIGGIQMQMAALRWEIYSREPDPLLLGNLSLAQVLPVFLFALVAGQAADRFNRKTVIVLALVAMAAASAGLLAVSLTAGPILAVYACMIVMGTARAFLQPAKQALLTQLVDREHFSNAVAWNSGGFHLASVAGPALCGALLYWFESPPLLYALGIAASVVFLVLMLFIKLRPVEVAKQAVDLHSLLAGVRFVSRNEVILGAMALDMFAVLLGGAVILLPAFAKDILHVGPRGFGWLEAAPAAGACVMSLWLAHRPPLDRAGLRLLLAVAGFGVTMIVFGFSRSFALSLVALFLSGLFDNISVVIRQTLIQMQTPDSMRGRVSAINGLFISTSNELGGYESGVTADWFGTIGSVVGGGIGTLLVVITGAWLWPRLRNYDRLDAERQCDPEIEDCDDD